MQVHHRSIPRLKLTTVEKNVHSLSFNNSSNTWHESDFVTNCVGDFKLVDVFLPFFLLCLQIR